MRTPAVLVIAAALIASAAWAAQAPTTGRLITGIVVANCNTAPFSSGQYNYAPGTQGLFTINPGGQLCILPPGAAPVCATNLVFDWSDTTGCQSITTVIR